MTEGQERKYTLRDGFRDSTTGTFNRLGLLVSIFSAFSLLQHAMKFGLGPVILDIVGAYRKSMSIAFGYLFGWLALDIPPFAQDIIVLWGMLSASLLVPRATVEDAIISYKYYMGKQGIGWKLKSTWRMLKAWLIVLASVIVWPWALAKILQTKNSYDGWLFGHSREKKWVDLRIVFVMRLVDIAAGTVLFFLVNAGTKYV